MPMMRAMAMPVARPDNVDKGVYAVFFAELADGGRGDSFWNMVLVFRIQQNYSQKSTYFFIY